VAEHPDEDALLGECAEDTAEELGGEEGAAGDFHVKAEFHIGAVGHG